MIKLNNTPVTFNGQGFTNTIYLSRYTKNLIDYAKTNSYVLPSNIAALDTFCKQSSNILDKLDLLYIFSGNGDINFKTLNLIDPTKYKATAFGGLTWSNTGVLGNGTNGYIDTNFNPSLLVSGQKYQLNDACRGGVVSEKVNPNNNNFDGCISSVTENTLYSTNNASQRINQGSTNLSIFPDMRGIGFKYLGRLSATNVKLVNIDVEYNTVVNSSSIFNSTQSILGRQSVFGVDKIASYFMGASLTFEETQTLRTNFNTYLLNINQTPIA